MEQNEIKFVLDNETEKVRVMGFPELAGREGRYMGMVWLCSGEKNGVIMNCL